MHRITGILLIAALIPSIIFVAACVLPENNENPEFFFEAVTDPFCIITCILPDLLLPAGLNSEQNAVLSPTDSLAIFLERYEKSPPG